MEFSYSSSARTALYIASAGLLLLGILLIVYAFLYQFLLLLVGLLFIVLAWYSVKEARLSKLILDDDSITLINSTSSKTLALKDIQGFRRIERNKLAILPRHGTGSKIIINNSFENRIFIETWLDEHLRDLDAIAIKKETEAILTNERFGESVDERQIKLSNTNKIANSLNVTGVIIFFWTYLYPKPYGLLVFVLLLMPVMVFVVIYRFKGLVQIAGGRGSAYPSVFIAVFMPCIALVSTALIEYNIYDYSFLFEPIAIIFLVAVIITYTLCNEMGKLTKSKTFTLASLLICIGCYAYGATIIINGYNDTTTAQALSVKVNAKYKSSGRTTTYYLKLDAWGHYKDAQNVSVHSKLYDAENTGDTVTVYLKQGNLNIPWFWIEATTGKNP